LKYPEENICLVVAESDLNDYPGMFVSKAGNDRLRGKWAEYPKTVKAGDYEYKRVLERYDYIARTSGNRDFPWRVFIVSTQDKDLLNNELIYKLSKPQVEGDFSWVKPGKSVWEWWHDAILSGVSFPSGADHLGLTLYKYYIDFAAAHGIEYITLDAGWSTLYVRPLCEYAASKNVKVILWYYFNLVVVNPRILDTFKSYGAAGIKVDLIERDDQLAIQWFELIASECAKRNLIVSFHGCAKPTGLQRAYPNIVNFEAVRGAECSKWDYSANPNYHLQFPFMRMLAGTLDYTPGSLRNVHYEQFTPIPVGVPKTIGTRAHEMAMYVVYDQTLAYLCDAPTEYEKYPELTDFIAGIPTTWDQTLPLAGEVGEYAVMARKKGESWYVGAMTNLTERDLVIDCAFLSPGIEYKAVILRDTRSSTVSAMSYMIEEKTINNESMLNCALSRGGGVVVHIEPISATGTVEINIDNEKVRSWYDSIAQLVMIESRYDLKVVRLIDINGRNYLIKSDLGSNTCQIPIQDYPDGIYLLSVWSGNIKSELKFLKN
ncbi:MAG TPA: glycoside hydrolase family 97 catalytic domain-containing protein, partial [Bacteroidales bacterium]|nr:glycoside hydrolase family 97 catalytic domain-containing protein [Bacteroidales bacterium]